MKKVITFLFSMSCIVALTTTTVNAQDNLYAFASSTFNASSGPGNELGTGGSGKTGTTAYSDFAKRFTNTSDVKWTGNDKYTFVYFKENDVRVRAVYTNKGKMLYTIRHFNGQQVPEALKSTMLKNGYGMQVNSAVEIKSRYATTSFVKLESKTSFSTVQILANGEVVEVEHFQKAK